MSIPNFNKSSKRNRTLNYLTTRQKVEGEISIWAVPKYNPEPGNDPFEYELFSGSTKPWRNGAVKVNTETIVVHLPGGLNLVAKAVETLREAQVEIRNEATKNVEELEQRIRELGLLTYQPASDEAGSGEGVVLLHPDNGAE